MSYYIHEDECIAYADLILFLVAVEENDTVLIKADYEHAPLIHALTKQAYKKGIRHVDYNIISEVSTIYRACYSNKEHLTYIPDSNLARLQECCDKQSCIISIRSPADPAMSAIAPSDALGILHKTQQEKYDFFHKAIISYAMTWIVSAFPTSGWAKNVYPDLEPREGVRKLWDVLKDILRLNEPCAITAWQKQQQILEKRGEYLNNKGYSALHFVGDGTDLTVKLNTRSRWSRARHAAKNGRKFQANVPTEEVYTSPDCRYTQGTVRVQRPITIFGKTVRDIRYTFEAGKICDCSASENSEILKSFLQAHERNYYMGEIALVDTTSKIWKSGLLFNSILYDENAGTHFALGAAYTSGYGFDTDDIPPTDELIAMGCNVSPFHIDFTIGYEGLSVFGILESDALEPIIENGVFVIS